MSRSPAHSDPQLVADLIGYQLGLVDPDERPRIEAAWGDRESFERAGTVLLSLLAPLDADGASPPADLADRVLAGVERAPRRRSPNRRAAFIWTGDVGGVSRPLFTLRELVGLAAAIVIFAGIFVPGYRTARFNAHKALCANNLRLLGHGYVQYADANGGILPYVQPVPTGTAWISTGPGRPPAVRNSRNAFELIRGQYVEPRTFHDPARRVDIPLTGPIDAQWLDFPDPRNKSYSTPLVNAPRSRWILAPQTPLASDQTPLADDQRRLRPSVGRGAGATSHGGIEGQNVLRADGSVLWSRAPNVGVENDDIYRVIGVETYTGTEQPRMRSDGFLIP